MICHYFEQPEYLFFVSDIPPLLYYSHIPTIVISLLVGLFVFSNGPKILLNQLLFGISILFSIWTIINLITWTNVHSDLILFYWSFFGVIFSLIAILSVYFMYVFLYKRDVSNKTKIIFLILLSPVFLLSATNFNIRGFDIIECNAFSYENVTFYTYYISLGIIAIIWILGLILNVWKKSTELFKKQIVLMGTGICSFLLMFYTLSFIGSYLTAIGLVEDSRLEMYGLFGMTFFISLIAYLIVKFKTFNIKLLAAQALVVALVILIGSQYFFVETTINRILVGITLLISSVIGLILVRSVRKVDEQREALEIANREQESLIHFITHQVKGFFTKSRNIFSTIIDEKENFPKDLQPLIEEGLRSDKEGIEVVSNILNAANLKTGKVTYKKEKLILNLLIEKIINENEELAKKKGLALNYNFDGKILEYHGDEARLRDSIENLIQNAINYTQIGHIDINLYKEPDQIRLTVKDTGIGLTEDDKKKLFNSGGRGADSLRYNVNSTGYGLYISKKIINEHHGVIIAESEGRDKGSLFTIKLPLN